MKAFKALFVLTIFFVTCIAPPQGWAQALSTSSFHRPVITALGLMPAAGHSVLLSASFDLAHFKGMVIDPQNPFKFDFIIHEGDEALSSRQKQQEYTKLIKYFLAALAVPDTDQWVNLSPYEKDRITSPDFGKTIMGRDLLAQDYLLKQLSSSLTNPETNLGRKFWNQVYEKVYQQFGTRQIPLNTFNKVWIVPDKAVIYEHGNTMYVVSSHLKVMTESDYLAMKKHQQSQMTTQNHGTMGISNQMMRRIIIPALEQEVNEGKNFAPLRQAFSGMLLATWYKRALKESILARLYANKEKLKGVDQDPKADERIYQEYLKAYKKGVYNMIKEEVDPSTQKVIPRKYFSGGLRNAFGDPAVLARVPESKAYDDYLEHSSNLAMVTVLLKKYAPALLTLGRAVAFAGALTLTAHRADAQAVTLAWNTSISPNIVGYNIYYGTSSGDYTNMISVGNVTNYTVSGLTYGKTYYFVAQTINNKGLLSSYSSQTTYTVPQPPVNLGTNQPVMGPATTIAKNGKNYTTFNVSFPSESSANSYTIEVLQSPTLSGPWTTNGSISVLGGGITKSYTVASTNSTYFYKLKYNFPLTNGTTRASFNTKTMFAKNGSASGMGLVKTNNKTRSLVALNSPNYGKRYKLERPVYNPAIYKRARNNTYNAAMINTKFTKGGIDLSASNLEMQIKRDGAGIVLPLNQQNLENIHIDGLVPVILGIKPAENLLFSQAEGKSIS